MREHAGRSAGNVCRLPRNVPLGEPSLALTLKRFRRVATCHLCVAIKVLCEYNLRR
jgi:hypothetical protein